MAVAIELLRVVAKAVEEEGKKRFRSLFWKVRAEIRRQMSKEKERKQRFSFHYDPFSYALNFDDTAAASVFFFCRNDALL